MLHGENFGALPSSLHRSTSLEKDKGKRGKNRECYQANRQTNNRFNNSLGESHKPNKCMHKITSASFFSLIVSLSFSSQKGTYFYSYDSKFRGKDFQLGPILGTEMMLSKLKFSIYLRKIVSLCQKGWPLAVSNLLTLGRGVCFCYFRFSWRL